MSHYIVHIWVNVSRLTNDFYWTHNSSYLQTEYFQFFKTTTTKKSLKKPQGTRVSLPSWPLRVTVQPLHLLLSTDASQSQIFQGHTKRSLPVFQGSSIFGQLHFLIRAWSGCYLSVQGAHLTHFRQTPDLCHKCLQVFVTVTASNIAFDTL